MIKVKSGKVILHIITSLERGGAQKILFYLVKNGIKKNIKHIIIVLREKTNFTSDFKKIGIDVYHLNGKNIFKIPFILLKLIKLIRIIKPSILQTWLYHADLLGSIATIFNRGIPIIWTIHHASNSLKYESLHTKVSVLILAKISSFVPKSIIYCSELSFSIHKKFGYCDSKAKTICNGIDTNIFKPNSQKRLIQRKKLSINQNEILIGLIARYDPNKGISYFLNIAKTVLNKKNNVKFLMCGTDMNQQNQSLMNQIYNRSLQKNIILLGERKDIASVYNSLDLLICTSITESFGLVIFEAISSGVDVISFDIPALRNIVDDKNLVIPGDSLSFANKIIYFINNRNNNVFNNNISREAIIKKYDINNMINKYNNIYFNN